MARINYRGDAGAESPRQGGQAKFQPAPRGIYTLQVADHSDGEVTQSGKNLGTPRTKLVCEIADKGAHFGKRVWHNVVWIPRGNGEKPNPGHGMAVHFLHAVGMQYDGDFSFEESDLQGRQFRALLGVTTYDKVVNGKTYTNEKNVVEEVYTERHPEPASTPPPRKDAFKDARELLKHKQPPQGQAEPVNDEDIPF